jgi:hypothetical protein
MLVTVKGRVMRRASGIRQKRRRIGLAGLLIGGAAVLIIGGAGTAVATGYVTGVFHTIPHSTNRPSDPPLPADYDQDTNNQLQPSEASLGQLWALANSEFDGTPTGGGNLGIGLTDFSSAITARCYPLLDEAQIVELDQLKAGYETLSSAEALQPARAYFVRATELCM